MVVLYTIVLQDVILEENEVKDSWNRSVSFFTTACNPIMISVKLSIKKKKRIVAC